MSLERLNSIAARVAIAIFAAIVLGVAMEVGVGQALSSGALSRIMQDKTQTQVVVSGASVLVTNPRRNVQMLSSEIATLARLAGAMPIADRKRLVAALSSQQIKAEIRSTPISDDSTIAVDRRNLLAKLIALQIAPTKLSVIVTYEPRPPRNDAPGSSMLIAEVKISDGEWLLFRLPDADPSGPSWPRIVVMLIPLALLIAILSILTAWWVASPINKFAVTAERLGTDVTARPLLERGPYELRLAVRAFNAMQERLQRYLNDRTQMLAAMSHDLRAPVARLRLRAEFVEDEEQQRKMFGDLAAMNAMIDGTLAFARDDTKREPPRLVDLGNLIEDICEDVGDTGEMVTYSGPREIDILCRPGVIRRAITNLIENAVKYGGLARVYVSREQGRIVIAVEDDGPGIPQEEHERVFAPFYRLEPSRDPHTGGVGLGLSVARTIARAHGGDITLVNRASGGLCVRMELPT